MNTTVIITYVHLTVCQLWSNFKLSSSSEASAHLSVMKWWWRATFFSPQLEHLEHILPLNVVVWYLIKQSSTSFSKEMVLWSILLLKKFESSMLCWAAQWLCQPYTVGISTKTGIAPIYKQVLSCDLPRVITTVLHRGEKMCKLHILVKITWKQISR